MKQKCLWVLPKSIFPIRDGARVANYSLLKSLSPFLSELEIAVFNESPDEVNDKEKYLYEFRLKDIHFFNRKSFRNNFNKFFYYISKFFVGPLLPATTSYFQTGNLNHLLDKNNYDIIVFDCMHPFAGFTKKNGHKIIYRAHNVEQDLWFMAAKKTFNPILKIIIYWQGLLVARLENKLLDTAHVVWTLSKEDKLRFLQLRPHLKIELIPVGMEFQMRERRTFSNKIRLLFLGKLDWPPNREGLRWFLEEVWPFLDKTKFELNIVGSGNADWIKKYLNDKNIKFLGFVNDLNEIYQTMDISIVPVHFGSGTRIKVLECVSRGMPLLSTAMGVQGSDLSPYDYFHAESAQEWIDSLLTLNLEQAEIKSKATFYKYSKIYSNNQIAELAIRSI
jgi:glycosyltransferase involved in cell wall biosynthesis